MNVGRRIEFPEGIDVSYVCVLDHCPLSVDDVGMYKTRRSESWDGESSGTSGIAEEMV